MDSLPSRDTGGLVGPRSRGLLAGADRLQHPSPALLATLAIAAVIAALMPFDILVDAVTFGSPSLRVALTVALVLTGAACARRLGLRLEGHGVRRPALFGLLVALLVAIYVVILDAFLFRGVLAQDYVAFLHQPLDVRLGYFMLRAFNENVVYRLFAFTALTVLVSLAAGRRTLPFASVFAVMVFAQIINIGVNLVLPADEPWSAVILVYDILRYIVPGVIWACLFRRCGFVVAEVASVGCHLFLQPALGHLVG